MTDLAIRVDGLSKRYRLGQREPYKTLRDTIARSFAALFRHLRSTEKRVKIPRAEGDNAICSLKDVSLEVKEEIIQ